MKTVLVAAIAISFLAGRMCGGEAGALESQLRADIAELVRAKAQRPAQKEVEDEMVDRMTSEVKRTFPELLEAATSGPPTDLALRRALDDLDRIGAGAPRPVLISFYVELWKSERIGPQQRIIFGRLARAITEAAEKRKNNG